MHLRLFTILSFLAAVSALAEPPLAERGGGFRQHDPARPQPHAAAPGPAVSIPLPVDAVALLGGADDVKHWTNAKWTREGGVMRVVPGAKDQASTEASIWLQELE